jgi:hypothetical protein
VTDNSAVDVWWRRSLSTVVANRSICNIILMDGWMDGLASVWWLISVWVMTICMKDRKWRIEGEGWMGASNLFLEKFGHCPKINPQSRPTQVSKSQTYEGYMSLRNTTWHSRIDTQKLRWANGRKSVAEQTNTGTLHLYRKEARVQPQTPEPTSDKDA